MNAVGFSGRAVPGWAAKFAGLALLAVLLIALPNPASAQISCSTSFPCTITIASGNNQTGTIGSPLPAPLVVHITGGIGTFPVPVSGVTVTWTITSGSGTLSTATSVSNANGDASNTLTPGSTVVGVTASIPGGSVTFTENAVAPFDYSLANSGGVTVVRGASGATAITATLISGATQPVSFTMSGLPTGATATFSSTSCSPTCSTTLTITTAATTPTGTFPITVTGRPLSRTTTFNLVVNAAFDYSLANSGGVTLTAGASGATTVTATLISGATQPVGFTVSGLPSGATAAFSASSCSPTCSTTLSITTAATTPTGTFPITVTGSPLGRTTTFNLAVNAAFDYSLSNSGGVTVSAGASGATTITATLTSGPTQAVSFTVSGLPSGASAALSVTSCNPTCSTTLTIVTTATTPAGTFPVTVTGTPLGRTTSFNLVVTTSQLAIAIVAGNNQAGTIGVPLPTSLVVSVTQNGVPAAGVTVTWAVTGGSGVLAVATSVTGANGQASNSLTPTGPTTAVTASVPGASVTFTESATAVARTISIVSGNNQTGVINSTLPTPLVVSVTPPNPPVTVIWEVTGGARPSATATPTVNGLAQITLTLGPTPGPVTVRASISGGGVGTAVTFIVNDATSTAVAGLKTYTVLGNLAITTTTVQNTNIGLRLAALRRGTTGVVSVSGLSLNVAGQQMPLGTVASFVPGLGGGASADPSNPLGGLGIFLNGQGSFGDQDPTSREPGFKFDTQGMTLGGDYRVTDNIVLGAAFGYLHTAADLDQSGGRVKMNGYSGSLFGSYYVADKFYVDAIATYGRNDYGVTRNVTFGDGSVTARSDPDGRQLSVSSSAGYNFSFGPWTVGPLAKVTYINVHIDGFQERGADIFNLAVRRQTLESLATDLGGQVSYAISTPWGVLTPLARVEWEHEFKGGARFINGSLVADPLGTTFGAQTNNPDRNYVNLATGVTGTFQRGVSAFAHYETVLGRANVTNHSFTAGIRFQFE
jgi:outer membrane lipase/esterase